MKPELSVVMASYNRAHLLVRTVAGYNRVKFDLSRLEIVFVDDGSEDDTEQVVRGLDPRINLVYIKLRKEPGLWRDVASVINVGLRACAAPVIAAVHPEVVPNLDSLSSMVRHCRDNTYVNCVPYYLSPRDQDRLDTVPWLSEGNAVVRRIEGFYDAREGHPDYHPEAIDRVGTPRGHPHWLSWVFASMTRRTWARTGGFMETDAWGAVDLLFLQRRQKLGIENITLTGDRELVLHQNHDRPFGKFVPTTRDMAKCHAQAPALSVEDCQWPMVDHLWYPDPRERR